MPASPGRLLSTAAVWPFGGRVTDEVPMRAPEPSQTVIVTLCRSWFGYGVLGSMRKARDALRPARSALF
jgi:hypothetical protein